MVYIIVFIDFYPGGVCAPLDGLSVTLEEGKRQLVISNKALCLFQSLLVLGINPVLFLLGKQGQVHHVTAVRDHGDVFKSVVGCAAKVVLRLDLLDDNDVLDTNTKVAILVVAGLVRDDVTGLEGKLAVGRPGANAHRALVDVQERTDTVAGAVAEVETGVLEKLAAAIMRHVERHTQRNCLAKASSAKPVAPLGKMARSRAMRPLRTRVYASFSRSVGVPKCMVRVVSVVPS